MLWSLFAREFSQQARNIAKTVSNAPNLGDESAPSDPRRPSMRLAIEDVSKATSDPFKQKRKNALLTKMYVIYAIDVFFYLVVLVAVTKAVVTGEWAFSSDSNNDDPEGYNDDDDPEGSENNSVHVPLKELYIVLRRLGIFFFGMGLGVTLEALALYVHYKELRGMELTDAQKAASERVFDVRSTATRRPNLNTNVYFNIYIILTLLCARFARTQDVHFDIIIMALLTNAIMYVPTARYLDTLAQANSSASLS